MFLIILSMLFQGKSSSHIVWFVVKVLTFLILHWKTKTNPFTIYWNKTFGSLQECLTTVKSNPHVSGLLLILFCTTEVLYLCVGKTLEMWQRKLRDLKYSEIMRISGAWSASLDRNNIKIGFYFANFFYFWPPWPSHSNKQRNQSSFYLPIIYTRKVGNNIWSI